MDPRKKLIKTGSIPFSHKIKQFENRFCFILRVFSLELFHSRALIIRSHTLVIQSCARVCTFSLWPFWTPVPQTSALRPLCSPSRPKAQSRDLHLADPAALQWVPSSRAESQSKFLRLSQELFQLVFLLNPAFLFAARHQEANCSSV